MRGAEVVDVADLPGGVVRKPELLDLARLVQPVHRLERLEDRRRRVERCGRWRVGVRPNASGPQPLRSAGGLSRGFSARALAPRPLPTPRDNALPFVDSNNVD